MAPEIFNTKKHDGFKSDIFAIGVILFVMVMGNFPFHEGSKKDKYYSLLTSTANKLENTKSYWKYVGADESTSSEFRDLFSQMVALKGQNRPSLNEIKEHPWMQQDSTV